MTTAQAPALRLGAWALARRTQSPDRGVLILYHADRAGTSTSADKLMVGRVVALPGDSLVVHSGQLFVNGVAVSDYRHPRDTREQYALRLPREGGVYPLTSTNLVAYRAALIEEQRLFAPARGEVALHRLAPKDWLTALASNPYHTFCRDYYWVLTDDTSVAPDSRHLGILPADAIEGVILFAL